MSEFTRPHYERAPIAEALIDIRVANPDALTLDQLTAAADALANEFPIRHPIQQLMFGFQAAQPNAAPGFMNNQEQIGWRLHNKAQDRVLQLQRIGFTYSHLPPYTDWVTFRDEARRCWDSFQRTVAAALPSNRIALEDYLKVYPVVPDKMPSTAAGVYLQLQFAMPKVLPDARVILNVASGQADANGSHLLLDIDLFSNQVVEKADQLWTILEKFGTEKDIIFEACITDKIREAIK
jgi:uncharacterized protein (TIGR04255 family)